MWSALFPCLEKIKSIMTGDTLPSIFGLLCDGLNWQVWTLTLNGLIRHAFHILLKGSMHRKLYKNNTKIQAKLWFKKIGNVLQRLDNKQRSRNKNNEQTNKIDWFAYCVLHLLCDNKLTTQYTSRQRWIKWINYKTDWLREREREYKIGHNMKQAAIYYSNLLCMDISVNPLNMLNKYLFFTYCYIKET